MLYLPPSDFNWAVDNFGATYTDAGLGTSVPGGASDNTKGSNVNLLNGIANDCYGISICFSGGGTSFASRRQLTDILIDPSAGVGNAGSSWSVAIANLASNSPTLAAGAAGYWYYFPLYIPKGSAIGAAHQDSGSPSLALRVAVRVFGLPSRPDLLRVGTRVETLGVTLATTVGFTIVPGTGSLSSYTSAIGTLSNSAWWFQLGVLSNDGSMTINNYWFDLGADTSNTRLLLQGVRYGVPTSTEQAWKDAFGIYGPPEFDIEAGASLVARAAAGAAPDSNMSVVAYALGS